MIRAYRVIARIKNNRLWTAIRLRFPDVMGQSDAARRLNVSAQRLGEFLNMKRWPYSERRRAWWKDALSVAAQLRETPDYLFDPALYGRPAQAIEVELDRPALEAAGMLALEDPLARAERVERDERLLQALETLNPREERVLRSRYGIDDGVERSLEDVAADLGVCLERARQIEKTAIRKLRHPARLKRFA